MITWLLLCIHTSIAVILTDIPKELIGNHILANNLPWSTMNFGLTCSEFLPIAKLSLLSKFGNGTTLNIELLDQCLDATDDDREIQATKKLILRSIPPLKTSSLIAMEKFELAKSNLFSPDRFEYLKVLSEEFPELSRIIVKRRGYNFHLGEFESNYIFPGIVDTIVPFIEPLGTQMTEIVICQFEPAIAFKLLLCPKYGIGIMNRVLSSGILSETENEAGDCIFVRLEREMYHRVHSALPVCMANASNMEQVLQILRHYKDIDRLAPYLINWTRYAHLKPVVLMLYSRCNLDSRTARQLAVHYAEMDQPLDYFEALHGRNALNAAKEFLSSFHHSVSEFTKRVPISEVSLLDIFEYGMLEKYSLTVLEAILALNQPRPDRPSELIQLDHDFYTVVLATKLNLPEPFIMRIAMTHRKTSEGLYERMGFKVKLSLPVFKLAVERESDFMAIKKIIADLPNDCPIWKYLQVYLEVLENDKPSQIELLYLSDYDRFDNAAELRQELYNFCLQKSLHFYWERNNRNWNWNKLAVKEVLQFFDGIDITSLIQYMPPNYTNYLRSSSYLIAFVSVGRRPGGLELLENHFGESNFKIIESSDGAQKIAELRQELKKL